MGAFPGVCNQDDFTTPTLAEERQQRADAKELKELQAGLEADACLAAADAASSVGDAPAKTFSRKDIEWAYHNLRNKKPDLDGAPSGGAIGLHEYYSKAANRGDFFRTFLTRLIPKEVRTTEDERIFVGAKQVENCDSLLLELKKKAEDAGS